MKFHRVIFLLLALMGLTVAGCRSGKSSSAPQAVGGGSAGTAKSDEPFFPIMAWNSVANDPAVLKKMKDCGLTVAGFVAPKTLDACQAAGLKAIVSDKRVAGYDWTAVKPEIARSNVTSLIAEVGKHPAVYGYYLRDEPGANFFPGLAHVAEVIHELAPDKWAYINLFPDYAENWQLQATNYQDYLERFVNTVHPTTLSYDNYAIMDDGGLRQNFWSILVAMRTVAVKYHLPFWNIVLSVAHFSYREPSAADLRFEVYSSLAYGARGIAYFTYFASETGNYRMAPIDQFGHETATWDYMRSVNLQVQKLAPTLLQLTSDEVYHFGGVPAGSHGPSTNSLVTGSDGQILVGDFTHRDGTRYVLLVNKDMLKSIPGWPKFRHAPAKVEKVSQYSGNLSAYEGENIWLAPGAGVLLKLTK